MTNPSASHNKFMKRFFLCLLTVLVVTALVVWFVPDADDFVELTFQRYLGRAAS